VTSALAPVEVVSALCAKHRGGTLTARHLSAALARFAEDHRWLDLIELVPPVLSRAEEVVRQTPARAIDAIHIASLLFLQEATGEQYVFLTADAKQRRGAQAAGLTVR
jgi:predicted nucleic acid-binding protein